MTRTMMTNNPTPKQIKQYRRDLQRYYAARQVFLWSAVSSFSLALVCFVGMYFSYSINYQLVMFLYILGVIGIVAGILLFILRSALYNRRISNRKRIIKEYKESQNKNG